MVHRNVRRASRGVLAALLATGATLVVAGAPAGATVVSTVANGDLTITADAADAITVTCVGDDVKVNGIDPTPTTDCALIDTISVTGAGEFANVIDLSGVANVAATVGDFDILATVTVDAGPGDDTITGTTLVDTLTGGTGNDTITGFRGNDAMVGGDGDDVMIWNNGDGTDTMDGEAGTDVARVNGSNGATGDAFTIAASVTPGEVRFDRTNLVPFGVDIATSETLDVNGLGGDDTISSSQVNGVGGLAALIALDLDGGDGNDVIVGGDGADLLGGGGGNDTITGFRGADTMNGNDGDDVLIWNNGDGSDVMEGGAGTDTARANGSAAAADTFTLAPSATPGRARFDRTNLVPFFLDIGTAELMDVRDAGTTTPDTFTVSGTAGTDEVSVTPEGSTGFVLPTSNQGIETLTYATLDGDDEIAARAGALAYTIDGGAGAADVLTVDGGGQIVSTSTVNVTGAQPITTVGLEHIGFVNTAPRGYWVLGAGGAVTPAGTAQPLGDASALALNQPIVGGAATPSGGGYWLVAGDGGVFSFGNADFFGSTGNIRLNQPIVGMTATPSGLGYWFVAADGGVFAYGDAEYFGSMGGTRLNQPIVGMAATPSGDGYWLVARDGGIFAFGDAPFAGSTGAITLNQPIVGMAATLTGQGYWFVAADGGIFSFGDAPFLGSTGASPPAQPIVGMAASPTGDGYWFVTRSGQVIGFGDATVFTAATTPASPVVGIIDRAL
jgi:hypothetical protein